LCRAPHFGCAHWPSQTFFWFFYTRLISFIVPQEYWFIPSRLIAIITLNYLFLKIHLPSISKGNNWSKVYTWICGLLLLFLSPIIIASLIDVGTKSNTYLKKDCTQVPHTMDEWWMQQWIIPNFSKDFYLV